MELTHCRKVLLTKAEFLWLFCIIEWVINQNCKLHSSGIICILSPFLAPRFIRINSILQNICACWVSILAFWHISPAKLIRTFLFSANERAHKLRPRIVSIHLPTFASGTELSSAQWSFAVVRLSRGNPFVRLIWQHTILDQRRLLETTQPDARFSSSCYVCAGFQSNYRWAAKISQPLTKPRTCAENDDDNKDDNNVRLVVVCSRRCVRLSSKVWMIVRARRQPSNATERTECFALPSWHETGAWSCWFSGYTSVFVTKLHFANFLSYTVTYGEKDPTIFISPTTH